MCPLLGIHGVAWAYGSGSRGPSLCLLARIHETLWASAIPGWIHPLRCLPASMGLHGRPRRSERCMLSAHADTHHSPWVCPSLGLGTCLRATRSPMEPHGCVPPVDAGAPRADADTDPWQRRVPSAGRERPWAAMISAYDGIGTPKPTTRAPMRGDGYRDTGPTMDPCRGRLGPSSTRERAWGSSVSGSAALEAGKQGTLVGGTQRPGARWRDPGRVGGRTPIELDIPRTRRDPLCAHVAYRLARPGTETSGRAAAERVIIRSWRIS